MIKIILAVAIVAMISTTCLADVEPEGLFSVEGTLWGSCVIGCVIGWFPPFVGMNCANQFGFYQGKIYHGYHCDYPSDCLPSIGKSFYIDLIVTSIAYDYQNPSEQTWVFPGYYSLFSAIMQPAGLGICSIIMYNYGPPLPSFGYITGIMFKINDNWTPTEVE